MFEEISRSSKNSREIKKNLNGNKIEYEGDNTNVIN
jgi:hypothetical protein